MTNVLFLWQVNPELQAYLKQGLQVFPDINLIFLDDPNEDHLLKHAPQAHVMVGWRHKKTLLLAAENLVLAINPGAGVQHLIELFREINQTRSILLANGHGNSYFTAQHTVALLLALTNKIVSHHNWMVDRQWRKGDDDAISIPLRSRKVGFLGYGAVNQKVHRFLSGFEVEFSILHRQPFHNSDLAQSERGAISFYTPAQLDLFLEDIEILIIGIPQTSQTVDMIKLPQLERLGKEGLLVNISRGIVINEEDLYIALREKIIAGAALDVWYNYRPDADDDGKKFPASYPFYELDNVVLSPHRAASPFNDLRRWDEVIENIKRIHQHTPPYLNIVDLEHEY